MFRVQKTKWVVGSLIALCCFTVSCNENEKRVEVPIEKKVEVPVQVGEPITEEVKLARAYQYLEGGWNFFIHQDYPEFEFEEVIERGEEGEIIDIQHKFYVRTRWFNKGVADSGKPIVQERVFKGDYVVDLKTSEIVITWEKSECDEGEESADTQTVKLTLPNFDKVVLDPSSKDTMGAGDSDIWFRTHSPKWRFSDSVQYEIVPVCDKDEVL